MPLNRWWDHHRKGKELRRRAAARLARLMPAPSGPKSPSLPPFTHLVVPPTGVAAIWLPLQRSNNMPRPGIACLEDLPSEVLGTIFCSVGREQG